MRLKIKSFCYVFIKYPQMGFRAKNIIKSESSYKALNAQRPSVRPLKARSNRLTILRQ